MGAREADLVAPARRTTASWTLVRLSATIDRRDGYTAGHSRRVRAMSVAIGAQLELASEELGRLGEAALYHDVGKAAIPDDVLLKPAGLTKEEWAIMRTHSTEGARMAEREGMDPSLVAAIRHHHEHYDGSGYPDGLAGDAIPLFARVIHVADAVDSMVTSRVYRASRPLGHALLEVRGQRGRQFCPRCVDGLERVLSDIGGRASDRRRASAGYRAG
jgi:putative nucleotidyltransferase with HDIG domain